MQEQGLTVRWLAVEVQNVGRFPVAVRSATAKTEDGFGMSSAGGTLNPGPEDRIEPFAFSTWYVQWDGIQAMVDATAATRPGWNRAKEVRMEVEPAFGKPIVTKEFVTITPPGAPQEPPAKKRIRRRRRRGS